MSEWPHGPCFYKAFKSWLERHLSMVNRTEKATLRSPLFQVLCNRKPEDLLQRGLYPLLGLRQLVMWPTGGCPTRLHPRSFWVCLVSLSLSLFSGPIYKESPMTFIGWKISFFVTQQKQPVRSHSRCPFTSFYVMQLWKSIKFSIWSICSMPHLVEATALTQLPRGLSAIQPNIA